MAVDLHIIGRVGEDHASLLASHQQVHHLRIQGVAADQPVCAEVPNIAQADPLSRSVWQDVVLGITRLFRREAFDQSVDFRDLKTYDADIEAQVADRRQGSQLLGQNLIVPAGIQSQLVVRNHIGALFRLGHVLDAQAGHLRHTKLLRRRHPAVAGKDRARLVDQHRIGEAESFYRRRDLADLLFGMGPGIASPGPELVGGNHLDSLCHDGGLLGPELRGGAHRSWIRPAPILRDQGATVNSLLRDR